MCGAVPPAAPRTPFGADAPVRKSFWRKRSTSRPRLVAASPVDRRRGRGAHHHEREQGHPDRGHHGRDARATSRAAMRRVPNATYPARPTAMIAASSHDTPRPNPSTTAAATRRRDPPPRSHDTTSTAAAVTSAADDRVVLREPHVEPERDARRHRQRAERRRHPARAELAGEHEDQPDRDRRAHDAEEVDPKRQAPDRHHRGEHAPSTT